MIGRTIAAVACAALWTTGGCKRKEAPADGHAYPFYFYESTGANKYVLIDGSERAIEFDAKTSNEAAVKALLSLKWNVLYPNSKGVVTLLGTYRPDTHTFSLQHWFLPSRFQAYPGETTLEPGSLQWRDTLDRNDFDPRLNEEPGIYQRTSRQERGSHE